MSSHGQYGPTDPTLPRGTVAKDNSTSARFQDEASDDLLEVLQEGYLRLDAGGLIIRANAAAAAITGVDRSEMLGRTMRQVWPGWGQGPAIREVINCLKSRRDCVVIALLHADESLPRWVRLRLDHLDDGARILALDVSARVLAEQAQSNSDVCGYLSSHNRQGVLRLDREGRVIEANSAALDILGLSREQVMGRQPQDPAWGAIYENGTSFPAHLQASMQALATGHDVIGQVMGVHNPRGGDTRWLMVNATPQFQAGEDSPFQVFVTFTDMTELKLAQDETQMLSSFPRQNPHPVLRVDSEGRVLYANPAADLLLANWQIGVGDSLPADQARFARRLLQTGRNGTWEQECPPRFYTLIFTPMTDQAVVQIYGLEITELKQVQQDLAWQLEVRTILSEFSRSLIVSPPHDLVQLSLRVLGQARTLTGSEFGYVGVVDPKTGVMGVQTINEMLPNQCRMYDGKDVIAFKPGARGDYNALWGHALNTRRSFFTNDPSSHRASKGLPAGHLPVERFLSVPVLLGEELVGQISLANPGRDYFQRDLNAIGQLAEVFALALQGLRAQESQRKAEEQLRQSQKMEALGALAGGIAHDFNNLLQAMRGYLHLAQYDEGMKPETAGQLKAVDAAVTRASDLVRRILTFSRQVEPQKRTLDLNELVRQEVRLLERTLPKMISLQTSLAADLHPVDADPVQLEQVLLNLAGNARDAMADAGRLTIETSNVLLDEEFTASYSEMKPGPYVWLRVSDTGHGMDAATAKQIFEPFFTTKPSGKGTGLGLATAYGIIKSHGGHINVYSEKGVGTTFNIYLPARDGALPAVQAKQAPQEVKGGHETILLVDDEASILDAGRRLLRRHGYNVVTALSGEEALDIYARRRGEIALVVMDLGMPGMGGLNTLLEMKRLFPEIRVVVASGYTPQNHGRDIFEAGALAFLHKPYQLADLLGTVRQALDEPLTAPTPAAQD